MSKGVVALTADKSAVDVFQRSVVADLAKSAGNEKKRNCDLGSSEHCGGFWWFVLLSLPANVKTSHH